MEGQSMRWIAMFLLAIGASAGLSGGSLEALRHSREVRAEEILRGERPLLMFGESARRPNLVALTFDDGPDSENTLPILDILRRHRAGATFFVIGAKVEVEPEITRAILSQGFELGNHSHTHPNLARLDPTRLDEEINLASTQIEAATGTSPTFLRPPGGQWNQAVAEAAAAHGLTTVLWTANSSDFNTEDPKKIAKNVLSQARPGGIILLHDTVRATREALPAILKGLKRKGLRPVSVGELLRQTQSGPTAVRR